MSYNFYIGQDIVCIKTHSQGLVKEGDIFTVKGVKASFCKCKIVILNVGLLSKSIYAHCAVCECEIESDMYHWFSESLFAPLDTLTDISEIEEILNEPIHY